MGLFGSRNAKWEAAGYVTGKNARKHTQRSQFCDCHCTPCQCTDAQLNAAQRNANMVKTQKNQAADSGIPTKSQRVYKEKLKKSYRAAVKIAQDKAEKDVRNRFAKSKTAVLPSVVEAKVKEAREKAKNKVKKPNGWDSSW